MSRHDLVNMTRGVAAKHILNLLQAETPYVVVRYEYHGSGDSMDHDEVTGYHSHDDVGQGGDAGAELRIPEEIQTMISEFGYAVTEEHHGGWENNEGGHGHVDFIVKPAEDDGQPRVVQNHWDYVQSEEHGGEHVY